MRRRSLLALSLLGPALPRLAAGQAAALPVVASFSILGDLVRQVAGPDIAALRVIAGPDTDAHGFQPRPSDAEAMRGAAVLVRNGLGFDPWFDRLARAAGGSPRMVTATEGVTPRTMEAHAHSHGPTERRTQHSVSPRRVNDPHAWQDVRLAQQYVRNIARGLAAADPARAAAVERNAEAAVARLGTLDAWVRAQVATVPEARRKVLTSHDAFGYFGAAYGIQFLAPQGLSTASEASAADVARLIRQVRAEGITAVFVEAATAPATLERLAREAGVRVRGRLYADTLSQPNGPAPSYEAMVRHNVGLMVPAMRGEG
ncbi:MAG: zinc ABC transporter substrate-binding protein [Acetobacteraceae bacterium]|nr:zinc ABC transporter substrate-binding protein [Acetobacteraceae bacterium]